MVGTSILSQYDLAFILESLEYTKSRFDNYSYPTYELRRQRLELVESVIAHVRAYRDSLGKDSMDTNV